MYYYIKTAYSNDDIHTDTIEKDESVNNIHNNAEKFDEKTEELFKYLQVFTACCDSFSQVRMMLQMLWDHLWQHM